MYRIKVKNLEVLYESKVFRLDGAEGSCLEIAANVLYEFFETRIMFFDNLFDHSDMEKILKTSNSFGFFDREEGEETVTELRFTICEDYLGSILHSSLDFICVEDEEFMKDAFEEFRIVFFSFLRFNQLCSLGFLPHLPLRPTDREQHGLLKMQHNHARNKD